MEPLAFIAGTLWTLPVFVGVVGLGVTYFFLSPHTREYRDRLLGINNSQEPYTIDATEPVDEPNTPKTMDKHIRLEPPSPTITSRTMGSIGSQFFSGDNSGWETIEPQAPPPSPTPSKQFPKEETYPIWVSVRFNDKSNKLYHYLLGDASYVNVGDKVIVYVRRKLRVRRQIATVAYISLPSEKPPLPLKSCISIKVCGEYMASRNGQKYHHPWCREMDDVSEYDALWFDSKENAKTAGYQPCKKCQK